jgi:hypothetical protein
MSSSIESFKTPYDPITGEKNYTQYDPKTDPHIFEFGYNKDLLEKCNKPVKSGIFSLAHENGWKYNRNCNALYDMMKQKFTKRKSYTELQPKIRHHIMELFPKIEPITKFEEQFQCSIKQNQITHTTCNNLAVYDNEEKYHYEPYSNKDPYINVFNNKQLLEKCNEKNYDGIPRWKRSLSCQGLYRLAQKHVDQYPVESSKEKEKNKCLQTDLVKFYVSNLYCMDDKEKQTVIVKDIIEDLSKK